MYCIYTTKAQKSQNVIGKVGTPKCPKTRKYDFFWCYFTSEMGHWVKSQNFSDFFSTQYEFVPKF